jgi:cytochrome b561
MLHRSLGFGVLALTVLRLAWRQGTAVPPLPAGVPAPQRLAARAVTVAFYALLGLQPLLGLAASLLHGDQVVLFGRVAVPAVLPVDKALAYRIFAVHGWAALALLALIGLHMAAALHHHVIRRDQVLAGMLPRRSPSPVLAPAQPGEARLPR